MYYQLAVIFVVVNLCPMFIVLHEPEVLSANSSVDNAKFLTPTFSLIFGAHISLRGLC